MAAKDINDLGKYGLKDFLASRTKNVQSKNQSTKTSIDADAIVTEAPTGYQTVVATSIMLEGINFDLTYMPLKHLGYKSAINSLSKIYAMNAKPTQLCLNLAISKRFDLNSVQEFVGGFVHACDTYGADLASLDVTTSVTGLSVATTAIGQVEKNQMVTRDNAHDTDLICVSGDLGSAYMGLQLLEREKAIFLNAKVEKATEIEFQPDFAGKEYLLERQMKPEARKDIIEILASKHIKPTSMTEVNDGLATALIQLCKGSNVGCHIYESKIPIDYQTASMAEEFNMNLTAVALNGGDDFELLFTVPLSKYEDLQKIEGINIIGRISEKKYGMLFETRDGLEMPIISQGWKEDPWTDYSFDPRVEDTIRKEAVDIEVDKKDKEHKGNNQSDQTK